ncbi:RNA pseudouridine synthase [Lacticaseibacillus chiayiensis]|uniref:Pseudouridine synthase n=1 Tax=Lacticaseibacillus chiayiensis TaxID=2100821 RepID=A0A4Q1UCB7_9LACO|nr:RluA family pseudouridine synthase [Lacticaseibacillus chiayiensis]QVI33701.1 RluA family pseudouridine synthase [Lacticaseibacillus chiayiensis]RXT29634.1 RNA pseudouridine synthase [Lacticaseibacillus chiayiensis]RXT59331.1 RNA pseudouridine synthase [Lacticaseibacillus chiayiensis]
MLFQTTAIAQTHASLREQLQSWLIPRKRQHQMRIARSIQVNGHYRHFNESIITGDRITMTYDEPLQLAYVPETPHLKICYEDDDLLIVDKPAGIKTHPNQPGETGTLMNQAAAYLAPSPALITHRLDMATSGLLVIAKNPLAQAIINRQLATRSMHRDYLAVVQRGIAQKGCIRAAIGRDPEDKRKRMIRPDGFPAVTHYRRIAETSTTATVLLQLETGRTHQIRVHLASIGYPIIGDPLYTDLSSEPRMRLHAYQVRLTKPLSDKEITVISPTPF